MVNIGAISKDFLFVSLVTNWVSLEEVCLPSFDVLNLVASCLDDENEIPLNVIALFSAINSFNSSPQLGDICLLVQGLDKISQFLPFVCVDAVLDVIIQSWQFRRGGISFMEVISSCHHIQYLCWYRFLMEFVSSSRDVVNDGHHTTNIPTDSHTVTTTDIITNMSIYIHLLFLGNNKIIRTYQHISLLHPFPTQNK